MLIFGTAALWVGLSALFGVIFQLYNVEYSPVGSQKHIENFFANEIQVWEGDSGGILTTFFAQPDKEPPVISATSVQKDPVEWATPYDDVVRRYNRFWSMASKKTPELPSPTPEVVMQEPKLYPSQDLSVEAVQPRSSGVLNITGWWESWRNPGYPGRKTRKEEISLEWTVLILGSCILVTATVLCVTLRDKLQGFVRKVDGRPTVKGKLVVNKNNYKTLSVLGVGEFSKIYLAKNKVTHDRCVIKSTPLSDLTPVDYDVCTEVSVLEIGRKCPFILGLKGYYTEESYMNIVMDYAEGNTLEQIVSKKAFIPECSFRVVMAQIVSALEFLHSHRIIHRDVEPSNIIVSSAHKATLLDMGSARLSPCNDGSKPRLNKNKLLFLAPEVAWSEPYDCTADYWSLGVTLYWYLYQRFPFTGKTLKDLCMAFSKSLPEFPSHHYYSRIVRDFTKKLLVKEASERLGHTESSFGDIKKHCFLWGVDWVNLKRGIIHVPVSRSAPSTASPSTTTETVLTDRERTGTSYENLRRSDEEFAPSTITEACVEEKNSVYSMDSLAKGFSSLDNPSVVSRNVQPPTLSPRRIVNKDVNSWKKVVDTGLFANTKLTTFAQMQNQKVGHSRQNSSEAIGSKKYGSKKQRSRSPSPSVRNHHTRRSISPKDDMYVSANIKQILAVLDKCEPGDEILDRLDDVCYIPWEGDAAKKLTEVVDYCKASLGMKDSPKEKSQDSFDEYSTASDDDSPKTNKDMSKDKIIIPQKYTTANDVWSNGSKISMQSRKEGEFSVDSAKPPPHKSGPLHQGTKGNSQVKDDRISQQTTKELVHGVLKDLGPTEQNLFRETKPHITEKEQQRILDELKKISSRDLGLKGTNTNHAITDLESQESLAKFNEFLKLKNGRGVPIKGDSQTCSHAKVYIYQESDKTESIKTESTSTSGKQSSDSETKTSEDTNSSISAKAKERLTGVAASGISKSRELLRQVTPKSPWRAVICTAEGILYKVRHLSFSFSSASVSTVNLEQSENVSPVQNNLPVRSAAGMDLENNLPVRSAAGMNLENNLPVRSAAEMDLENNLPVRSAAGMNLEKATDDKESQTSTSEDTAMTKCSSNVLGSLKTSDVKDKEKPDEMKTNSTSHSVTVQTDEQCKTDVNLNKLETASAVTGSMNSSRSLTQEIEDALKGTKYNVDNMSTKTSALSSATSTFREALHPCVKESTKLKIKEVHTEEKTTQVASINKSLIAKEIPSVLTKNLKEPTKTDSSGGVFKPKRTSTEQGVDQILLTSNPCSSLRLKIEKLIKEVKHGSEIEVSKPVIQTSNRSLAKGETMSALKLKLEKAVKEANGVQDDQPVALPNKGLPCSEFKKSVEDVLRDVKGDITFTEEKEENLKDVKDDVEKMKDKSELTKVKEKLSSHRNILTRMEAALREAKSSISIPETQKPSSENLQIDKQIPKQLDGREKKTHDKDHQDVMTSKDSNTEVRYLKEEKTKSVKHIHPAPSGGFIPQHELLKGNALSVHFKRENPNIQKLSEIETEPEDMNLRKEEDDTISEGTITSTDTCQTSENVHQVIVENKSAIVPTVVEKACTRANDRSSGILSRRYFGSAISEHKGIEQKADKRCDSAGKKFADVPTISKPPKPPKPKNLNECRILEKQEDTTPVRRNWHREVPTNKTQASKRTRLRRSPSPQQPNFPRSPRSQSPKSPQPPRSPRSPRSRQPRSPQSTRSQSPRSPQSSPRSRPLRNSRSPRSKSSRSPQSTRSQSPRSPQSPRLPKTRLLPRIKPLPRKYMSTVRKEEVRKIVSTKKAVGIQRQQKSPKPTVLEQLTDDTLSEVSSLKDGDTPRITVTNKDVIQTGYIPAGRHETDKSKSQQDNEELDVDKNKRRTRRQEREYFVEGDDEMSSGTIPWTSENTKVKLSSHKRRFSPLRKTEKAVPNMPEALPRRINRHSNPIDVSSGKATEEKPPTMDERKYSEVRSNSAPSSPRRPINPKNESLRREVLTQGIAFTQEKREVSTYLKGRQSETQTRDKYIASPIDRKAESSKFTSATIRRKLQRRKYSPSSKNRHQPENANSDSSPRAKEQEKNKKKAFSSCKDAETFKSKKIAKEQEGERRKRNTSPMNRESEDKKYKEVIRNSERGNSKDHRLLKKNELQSKQYNTSQDGLQLDNSDCKTLLKSGEKENRKDGLLQKYREQRSKKQLESDLDIVEESHKDFALTRSRETDSKKPKVALSENELESSKCNTLVKECETDTNKKNSKFKYYESRNQKYAEVARDREEHSSKGNNRKRQLKNSGHDMPQDEKEMHNRPCDPLFNERQLESSQSDTACRKKEIENREYSTPIDNSETGKKHARVTKEVEPECNICKPLSKHQEEPESDTLTRNQDQRSSKIRTMARDSECRRSKDIKIPQDREEEHRSRCAKLDEDIASSEDSTPQSNVCNDFPHSEESESTKYVRLRENESDSRQYIRSAKEKESESSKLSQSRGRKESVCSKCRCNKTCKLSETDSSSQRALPISDRKPESNKDVVLPRESDSCQHSPSPRDRDSASTSYIKSQKRNDLFSTRATRLTDMSRNYKTSEQAEMYKFAKSDMNFAWQDSWRDKRSRSSSPHLITNKYTDKILSGASKNQYKATSFDEDLHLAGTHEQRLWKLDSMLSNAHSFSHFQPEDDIELIKRQQEADSKPVLSNNTFSFKTSPEISGDSNTTVASLTNAGLRKSRMVTLRRFIHTNCGVEIETKISHCATAFSSKTATQQNDAENRANHQHIPTPYPSDTIQSSQARQSPQTSYLQSLPTNNVSSLGDGEDVTALVQTGAETMPNPRDGVHQPILARETSPKSPRFRSRLPTPISTRHLHRKEHSSTLTNKPASNSAHSRLSRGVKKGEKTQSRSLSHSPNSPKASRPWKY